MSQLPAYLLEGLDETPAPQSPVPPKQRGWLRRNLWGLLTIVPVTAAMLVVYLDKSNAYERFWKFEPRVPVVAVDGWADYAGAKIRLVEFGPAKDLRESASKAFMPPEGLLVWRAVIEYDVADQKSVGGCKLELEDDKGRFYSTDAAELSSARGVLYAGCTAEDRNLNRYQTFIFFITPSDSRPVAVRITLATKLPRYAWLSVEG